MKRCADKPCPTCPWRRTSTVGGEDIPGFDLDKMRNLANTVPPKGSDADAFRPIMACHHSPEGKPYACAGYIARHGQQNINVRMLALEVDLNKVVAQCESIELYDNFYDMLADYERAHES